MCHGQLAARATPPLADKPDKPPAGPTVAATVKSVDADKHTLTAVTGQKGQTEEKTFSLAKDVKISLESGGGKGQEKEGSVADLAAGAGVLLQLSPDGKTVVGAFVHGASLHGVVKVFDPAKGALTVTVKEDGKTVDKELTLGKDARVIADDGLVKSDKPPESKPGELTAGVSVTVHLSAAEKQTALEVRVLGETTNGTLKGVDAGNNTVTVETKEAGGLVEKTFTLVKDAKITSADGKDLKLTDLQAGARVSVQASVTDKKAAAYVRVQKE
jgi:hypothetical protein